MKKKAGFFFYTGDWMKDPQLAMCSDATIGIWSKMLCAIFELDNDGTICGTVAQLARSCHTSERNMRRAIEDLQRTGAAHICGSRNGIFTVVSRRLQRECRERKSDRDRKLRPQGGIEPENAGDRKSTGNKPEIDRNSRARARSSSSSQHSNTAAAESTKLPSQPARDPNGGIAAADSGSKVINQWARNLIIRAGCESLTTPDLEIFYEAARLIQQGRLKQDAADIAADKAMRAKRNRAGLFASLIRKHTQPQES